jgi:hypothetical protein
MRRKLMRRVMERARFIAETAIAEGVHIAILSSPRGPCVFADAPTAPTHERQVACEASFRRCLREPARRLTLRRRALGASMNDNV